MRGTIAVGGSLAQRPFHGGHAWVFLQYLLGFRELGWDTVFVDRLEPGMCVDAEGAPVPPEDSVNLRYLQDVMGRAGLDSSWTVLYDHGRQTFGLDRSELRERLGRTALLLNVMGFVDDDEVLGAVGMRAFLDIDPGFGQMWQALGLHDLFRGHDAYITIGENIGRPDCPIPTLGIEWVSTKQPVVLDRWRSTAEPGAAFTSIGSWRGPFGPIDFEGRTYGLRVHEFRRFVDLPRRTGLPLEIALDIDDADQRDVDLVDEHGWRRVDPRAVAADPEVYRQYIHASRGELMVAKNMYVQARSGWVSDRSICYLASGRPVVAQDTGLDGIVPAGRGLLTFSTVDEAAHALEEVDGNIHVHAAAARDIAAEVFAAPVVLGQLLDRLGIA